MSGEFLLYETEDSKIRVECRFVEDTLWLIQALMAELFQKDARIINEHLQNIYEEGELEPGGNHPEISDGLPRGLAVGQSQYRPLQSRCDSVRKLQSVLDLWNSVPLLSGFVNEPTIVK